MAISIQTVRADEAPQMAYEWEVNILGSSASGNEPLLTQRVNNTAIPAVENETVEVNFKSQKTFFVGRDSSPHTVSVTFRDGEDGAIYRFFRNWKENGLNSMQTGGGMTRDMYAAEMIITLLAVDSETVTGTHRFTKIFPTSIGEITLDYSSSEIVTFDVTFSYDAHILE